jgi:hypothetical protein
MRRESSNAGIATAIKSSREELEPHITLAYK